MAPSLVFALSPGSARLELRPAASYVVQRADATSTSHLGERWKCLSGGTQSRKYLLFNGCSRGTKTIPHGG